MRQFSEREIRQEIKDQAMTTAWLCNSNGAQLVAKNIPNQIPIAKHLDRIFKTLKSATLSDGVYIVQCLTAPRSKSAPLEMPYIKGSGMSEGKNVFFSQNGSGQYEPGTLSPGEFLRLFADNARLQAENDMLRQQYAREESRADMLQETVDELREANTELAEGLSEAEKPGWTEQIGELLPVLAEMVPKPGPDPGTRQAIQALAQQQAQIMQMLQMQALPNPDLPPDPGPDPDEADEQLIRFLQENRLYEEYLTAKNHEGNTH